MIRPWVLLGNHVARQGAAKTTAKYLLSSQGGRLQHPELIKSEH